MYTKSFVNTPFFTQNLFGVGWGRLEFSSESVVTSIKSTQYYMCREFGMQNKHTI